MRNMLKIGQAAVYSPTAAFACALVVRNVGDSENVRWQRAEASRLAIEARIFWIVDRIEAKWIYGDQNWPDKCVDMIFCESFAQIIEQRLLGELRQPAK